eukprot:CAMPEP_0206043924 /NCGR_PEP_ID=MMETSP1466-20131121/10794_1 /ASSEMBLY_ACC=CAM_ASM_001126 /TAXON_ID=44452 /ORGANISM="Pavlova gyrans, Strain CCMP608" /LENGTH=131 /DNA_ID=CAMNT_0053418791 /DNA_START=469 /DNA_END=860 /DNA_ORIENTATION=+
MSLRRCSAEKPAVSLCPQMDEAALRGDQHTACSEAALPCRPLPRDVIYHLSGWLMRKAVHALKGKASEFKELGPACLESNRLNRCTPDFSDGIALALADGWEEGGEGGRTIPLKKCLRLACGRNLQTGCVP